MLAWRLAVKDQDYAFARPGLVAHKRRKLERAYQVLVAHWQQKRPAAAHGPA